MRLVLQSTALIAFSLPHVLGAVISSDVEPATDRGSRSLEYIFYDDEYDALHSQSDLFDLFRPRQNIIIANIEDLRKFSPQDLPAHWTPIAAPTTTPPPTRVRPDLSFLATAKILQKRSSFTFTCPTSVQCVDGGCCAIGDYCAIRDGSLGCCPIGSGCDAGAIPGCAISCYGICCDGYSDSVREANTCQPTAGDGGQASGVCKFVLPTNSVNPVETVNCPASFVACGQDCCPNSAGIVCDSTTVPGSPFCNVAMSDTYMPDPNEDPWNN